MAEKARRRLPLVGLMRRAVGRPYLLMAAIVLVLGTIWFTRLALQEFLLIDRLINVYTNDAQIKMDAYPIKAGVTAEVLEVLVKEGERVQKDQVLVRLVPDDYQAEVHRAEAVAEGIQQQIDELRLELPLAIPCVLERAARDREAQELNRLDRAERSRRNAERNGIELHLRDEAAPL